MRGGDVAVYNIVNPKKVKKKSVLDGLGVIVCYRAWNCSFLKFFQKIFIRLTDLVKLEIWLPLGIEMEMVTSRKNQKEEHVQTLPTQYKNTILQDCRLRIGTTNNENNKKLIPYRTKTLLEASKLFVL